MPARSPLPPRHGALGSLLAPAPTALLPALGLGLALALGIALALAGCGGGSAEPRLVAAFPLDDLSAIVPADDPEISFDPEISVDGGGSVHLNPARTRPVRLLEVREAGLKGPLKLTWKAHLRSRSLLNPAMLEIWVHTSEGSEFFARDLESDIRRSTDWTPVEVSWLVPAGVTVERVRLNLLVGAGHAWIDDARLLAGPPD